MPVVVVPYRTEWPVQFEEIAATLHAALENVPDVAIEHVGSTAVPGLAAKPILDIDVIVDAAQLPAAIRSLESIGYVHRGNLGVEGREAFFSPDDAPSRHVYVCERGALSVRNHLAVRDTLRKRPDLRDTYGAVKLALGADPEMDIDAYLTGKSPVLQHVLAEGDFAIEELDAIFALNTGQLPNPVR